MTRRFLWRPLAALLLIVAALVALRGSAPAVAVQEATPTGYSCADVSPMTGSPMAGMDAMGTPSAEMDMEVELDQLYIDMMIPHHQSIVALAEAALPRLQDERLRAIAQNIIDAQTVEIAELRGYRARLYGSPDPMPMDAHTMELTMQAMPGMGSMEEMAFQMDAESQVSAFCAAENPDLAFIDMVTAHHRMAIVSSEPVAAQGINEEIRAFAQRVIADQQREVEELAIIKAELTGAATPAAAASGDHSGHAGATSAETEDDGGMPPIRALTPKQVAEIERGEGAGFALAAELNGVPGPRHVLDLAVELGLTADQIDRVQQSFDAMKLDAIPAGERYLAAQRALEQDFRDGALTEDALPDRVAEVSRLQGELAAIHLAAHLRTAAILTADQIATYQTLRQAT